MRWGLIAVAAIILKIGVTLLTLSLIDDTQTATPHFKILNNSYIVREFPQEVVPDLDKIFWEDRRVKEALDEYNVKREHLLDKNIAYVYWYEPWE